MPLLQMVTPNFLDEGILLPPQVVDELVLYLKDVIQEIFLPSGGEIAADEGWAIAVWVDAHPFELLVALELAQQCLQAGIAVDNLLNLHLYYYEL